MLDIEVIDITWTEKKKWIHYHARALQTQESRAIQTQVSNKKPAKVDAFNFS